MRSRRRIVILQRWMMHYRVAFFRRLLEVAKEAEIDVDLLYGEPTGDDRKKKDWFRDSPFPGAQRLEQRRICAGQREAIWHYGVARHLVGADLVVSQQENRILRNHLLALMPRKAPFKLAWWGHGTDFQARNDKPADIASAAVRRFLLKRADWFFAYTSLSATAIQDEGFPANRITTLNNTIDVDALLEDYANVTSTDIAAQRQRLGIPADARIGVFVGGLYPAKRLDLLVEAGKLIRKTLPNFVLIVGGSGIQESFIREMGMHHEWLKFVGPVFGREKAVLLAASSVWLNPGLIGLAVVDAFAVGVPMVTTTYRHHSPEIAYLRDNENGIVTDETVSAFAMGALRLLQDDCLRDRLVKAGRIDAGSLTIDHMARSFLDGAQSAIGVAAAAARC